MKNYISKVHGECKENFNGLKFKHKIYLLYKDVDLSQIYASFTVLAY